MNTSKQVNVMIGLLFLTFVVTVGYLFNEANRQEVESAEINERNAERGARLFVQNCRNCHGLDGTGKDSEGKGTIGVALNAPHFLILGEDNVYGADGHLRERSASDPQLPARDHHLRPRRHLHAEVGHRLRRFALGHAGPAAGHTDQRRSQGRA